MKLKLVFSDDELAQTLSNSKPPRGIKISKPKPFFECKAPSELFWQIVIEFSVQVSASLLTSFIYDRFKTNSKKRARINRKNVTLKKRDILRLIQEEIAKHDTHKSNGNGAK